MAKRSVVLYTDNGNLSVLARNYLKKINIEFNEVDATTKEGAAELLKVSRQPKAPFLVVRGSHYSTSLGFDEFLYACTLDSTLSYDKFMGAKRKVQENVEGSIDLQQRLNP